MVFRSTSKNFVLPNNIYFVTEKQISLICSFMAIAAPPKTRTPPTIIIPPPAYPAPNAVTKTAVINALNSVKNSFFMLSNFFKSISPKFSSFSAPKNVAGFFLKFLKDTINSLIFTLNLST